MKPIALLIKARSADTPAALRYAKALSRSGNPPVNVFFFGAAVCQAQEPIQDEWRKLRQKSGVSLTLCSASAEKFGILSDADFDIGGLGELITNGVHDTRVVSFG